jgi:GTP-binding protein LepA
MDHLRNFCIIAHIDHGKSTLADRLLETTKTISARDMMNQVLDDMDLEREKGITIKSHAIQMDYVHPSGKKYVLNLIDTPGHVDFSYEVSRSIAACEGALLVVDAAQGIQAQTIANLYLAIENNLTIIPVLNKIDLPGANVELVRDEVVALVGCDPDDVILASAKEGIGIPDILQAIVARIPAPKGDPEAPLKALVFDSVFNSFRGTITYFRIFEGTMGKGDALRFMSTGSTYHADEIGVLRLVKEPRQHVGCGDVGYLITGVKEVKEVRVGDTITHTERRATEAIQGFREVKPMVFAGVYPVDTDEFEDLRASLDKLQLNDASLTFEPESSAALGFGFRVGFLGLLHLEIIQERLEREFNMTVITTVPNVPYRAYLTDGSVTDVNSPSDLPDQSSTDHLEEPYVKAQLITKAEFVGALMSLCVEKRGVFINQHYLTPERVELSYELPLSEIVFDFYDKLKSISKGYASLDYDLIGYRESELVRLDIMLNGEPVDALSALIHKDKAYFYGRRLCEKLKELIPKQQFIIAIQASIGSRIIARETISAIRKDVTAKCYGGDISRKRKLLEKQKKGKKRMRQVGNVEVPQSAFMAVLKLGD